MPISIRRSITLIISALLVVTAQLGLVSSAHALGDTDISVFVSPQQGGHQVSVCNLGTFNVKELTLNIELTNLSVVRTGIFPGGTNASNPGTFNSTTGEWSGLLGNEQCLNIVTETNATAAIGQTATIEATILSSVLEDDSPNENLDNDNDTYSASFTIGLEPDLVLETRLKTAGDIEVDSEVTYEVKIKNEGPGILEYQDFFVLAFVMPEGSTFGEIRDMGTSDNLSLIGCSNVGPISNLGFSALSSITGDVMACSLTVGGSRELPANSEYIFEFDLVAGETFANGEAEVIAVVESNDRDTAKLFLNLAFNENPLNFNNDNFQYLAYDPDALRVTMSRCPGQSVTTTDGTGCFIVSFNKKPYAPEFTTADFVLASGQKITDFTQLTDTTWRVSVSGIKPGTTFALTLIEGSVPDYSAVTNDVRVLGENTIRFESSLPATGKHVDWITPLALLLLGLTMTKIGKSRTLEDSALLTS